MATIVRRKSDNTITYFAQSGDFDAGYLIFIGTDGIRTHVMDTTPDTHEIINDVTLPKKYFPDCITYIDGTYTILTDVVNTINEKYAEAGVAEIEVEI
tara:strand:- start:56 stop:349 length:294 start_codon:yes stop_codon:yes gene_type:complete